jgi:hypothetical protein
LPAPESPPSDAAQDSPSPKPWEGLPPFTSQSTYVAIVYRHLLDTATTPAERQRLYQLDWKNLRDEVGDKVGFKITLEHTTMSEVRNHVRDEHKRARASVRNR